MHELNNKIQEVVSWFDSSNQEYYCDFILEYKIDKSDKFKYEIIAKNSYKIENSLACKEKINPLGVIV